MKTSRFLILAALLLAAPVQMTAQRPQSRSIYPPRLESFYNQVDSCYKIDADLLPRIGISVSTSQGSNYVRSVQKAGGVPLVLGATVDAVKAAAMLDGLDGLILTGGGDVNPAWYGMEKKPECGDPDPERDTFELMLLKMATDRNIPVLGICRGLQLINAGMGGTLIQDIPTEKPSDIQHRQSVLLAHEITVIPGSRMASIYGQGCKVNTHHHQAIAKLAPGLEITAWSTDSIPEAIEATDLKIMGVQFHPESFAAEGDPAHLRIFSELVRQSSLFRKAKDMHSRFISVDTHSDTPMGFQRGSSLFVRTSRGQVGVEKMREGFLDAQYLAAFISQKEETPESLKNALDQCQATIDAIYSHVKGHEDVCGIAVTKQDALLLKAAGKRAFFLGIENGMALGGDLKNIKRFKDQGVGYITLCHSSDNGICNSSTRTKDENKGLTAFGRKVVREMNRQGVLIDLSHASMGTFWDVMKYSKLPVICSHSGAKGVYEHDRNITDDQLRALAKNGGVIQVCIFAYYMSPDASKTDLDDVIRHIEHCIQVAGIDHVGIGSDFDGGGGVLGLNGSNQMIRITERLIENGHTEEEIAKIWGGNFFRVLEENQKAAR